MDTQDFEISFWEIQEEKEKVVVKTENAKITAWSYKITGEFVSFFPKTGNEPITLKISSIVSLS